ncbi:hypothetical protein FO470_17245 [Starkeya sp. 3C]|uniref:Uncharacterized protein n=1 Tax=Ancylobacter moscoviensis TaxID=2597768 RepID=A0ABY3DPC7_9HYPH|nr:hypothetical protein [Ancylobacter moscoviensis]TSJ60497.1 hypothetical protein FO470_17245 [Ancylobacter moscoviensis]
MAGEAARAGQKWRDTRGDYSLGTRLEIVRVMAVAEGYVMARRLGCMPFVMRAAEFADQFTGPLRERTPADRAALAALNEGEE